MSSRSSHGIFTNPDVLASRAILSAFEQDVMSWPEVRECHMIRGGGDFLLRLVARDTAHENALTNRLTAAPNVGRVSTLQTIHTAKDVPGVPLEGVKQGQG